MQVGKFWVDSKEKESNQICRQVARIDRCEKKEIKCTTEGSCFASLAHRVRHDGRAGQPQGTPGIDGVCVVRVVLFVVIRIFFVGGATNDITILGFGNALPGRRWRVPKVIARVAVVLGVHVFVVVGHGRFVFVLSEVVVIDFFVLGILSVIDKVLLRERLLRMVGDRGDHAIPPLDGTASAAQGRVRHGVDGRVDGRQGHVRDGRGACGRVVGIRSGARLRLCLLCLRWLRGGVAFVGFRGAQGRGAQVHAAQAFQGFREPVLALAKAQLLRTGPHKERPVGLGEAAATGQKRGIRGTPVSQHKIHGGVFGREEVSHGGADGREGDRAGRDLALHEKGVAHAQLGDVHGHLEELDGNRRLEAVIGILVGRGQELEEEAHEGVQRRRVEPPVQRREEELFHLEYRGRTELSPGEIRQGGEAGDLVVLFLEGSHLGIVVVVIRGVDLGSQMQGPQRGQECEVAAALGRGGPAVRAFGALGSGRAERSHVPVKVVEADRHNLSGQIKVIYHIVAPLADLLPPTSVDDVLLPRQAFSLGQDLSREVGIEVVACSFLAHHGQQGIEDLVPGLLARLPCRRRR